MFFCSECTFRSKEENFFEAHALQNHAQSKILFQNHSELERVEIKIETAEDGTQGNSKSVVEFLAKD